MMDKREQFLLHMYNQLWNSITRVEQGLWQFISLYAAILGLHWALGKSQPALAAYLTIVASCWGINIAINAGKWFERNRMMVINIERQFMCKDDIKKIMPLSYHKKEPRKLFTWLDRIHIFVFITIGVLSIYAYWHDLCKTGVNIAITIILIIGALVGTAYHWHMAWKELKDFVRETEEG